ncbi:MAG: hypothetical protein HYS17_11955 [Micavibrio aeruginosavorus]|uniref:Uncharacterized protein n=1 Tax=Micavibrio aeruginosavorus TaxID=349221 RepID=A0A7T5UGR4_9BACT|nr:MAG: hypothetical protein HYS17_11955 [Micavibrio aeruginosavorus]
MKRFFYRPLLAAALLNLMLVGSAHAYIDMGTGSMIFQMIVGGIVGASFTIKLYWRAIVKKVRRLLGMPVIENEAAEGQSHDSQHPAKD